MRYCKNCGLLAPVGADRCPQCGAPLPDAPATPAPAADQPHYTNDLPEVPALSEWATLAALLLFSIPVVGFILSVAWSFGFSKNPARKRLAQAWLIRTLVVAVAAALLCLWVAAQVVMIYPTIPYYAY